MARAGHCPCPSRHTQPLRLHTLAGPHSVTTRPGPRLPSPGPSSPALSSGAQRGATSPPRPPVCPLTVPPPGPRRGVHRLTTPRPLGTVYCLPSAALLLWGLSIPPLPNPLCSCTLDHAAWGPPLFPTTSLSPPCHQGGGFSIKMLSLSTSHSFLT